MPRCRHLPYCLRLLLLIPVFSATLLVSWLHFPTRALAHEPPELHWLVWHFPPTFLLEDNSAAGWGDRAMALINADLPAVSISQRRINFARGLREFTIDPYLCNIALLKSPEREAFITFSETAFVLYNYHAIIRQDQSAAVRPYMVENQLDLFALLQNSNLRLGLLNERSYSPALDALLARTHFPEGQLTKVSGDNTELLMRMLWAKRVDITLATPIESYYFAAKNALAENQIIALPVKGADLLISGHVGCANSEAGRALIANINPIVLQHRSTTLMDYMAQWLPDSMRDQYIADAQNFFLALEKSNAGARPDEDRHGQ